MAREQIFYEDVHPGDTLPALTVTADERQLFFFSAATSLATSRRIWLLFHSTFCRLRDTTYFGIRLMGSANPAPVWPGQYAANASYVVLPNNKISALESSSTLYFPASGDLYLDCQPP